MRIIVPELIADCPRQNAAERGTKRAAVLRLTVRRKVVRSSRQPDRIMKNIFDVCEAFHRRGPRYCAALVDDETGIVARRLRSTHTQKEFYSCLLVRMRSERCLW